MVHTYQQHRAKARTSRLTQIALATSIVVTGFAAPVHAGVIDTGNEDLAVRWDNQIRYNYGVRVQPISSTFVNSPTYDATELAVKEGGTVVNRADLLSEIDVVYKGKYGARISAAAWNDFSMSDNANGSASLAGAGFPTEYSNNQYNGNAKRYLKGPSGEFLDAFVFGSVDLGSVPVNLKLGQHVTYWGEGLFNLFHSISYSQAPLDLLKATSSPGIDAKEVFRPINQLSGQAQLTDDLSMGMQVMLDWQASKLPPGGTYFGAADATRADFLSLAPGFAIPVAPDVEPNKKSGQFGVNLRWSPPALGGTVGGYYRKFNEVMPWGLLKMSSVIPGVGVVPLDLHLAFAQDTELFGLSYTSNINGVNIGTELSYRKNTALNSGAAPVDASAVGFQGLEGARGNTTHFLVNSIYVLPETRLFKGGTLQAEFAYSHLNEVTSNQGLFNGEGTDQCRLGGADRGQAAALGLKATDVGCATSDYYGIQVGGNFDYPQTFPGVDLSIPFTYGIGLKGNAAVPGGGNEGASTASLGVTANYLNKHHFSLTYNESHTPYTALPSGAIVQNGATAVSNNHGWVSFTYKTSF